MCNSRQRTEVIAPQSARLLGVRRIDILFMWHFPGAFHVEEYCASWVCAPDGSQTYPRLIQNDATVISNWPRIDPLSDPKAQSDTGNDTKVKVTQLDCKPTPKLALEPRLTHSDPGCICTNT